MNSSNSIYFQVLWYRDTMQLDTTERRIMESRGSRHTLMIRKVHRSDFGNYTCVADNQLGKTRKSVQLTGKIYCRLRDTIDERSTKRDDFITFSEFQTVDRMI